MKSGRPYVTVRFTEPERESIRKTAARFGVSQSQLIRQALLEKGVVLELPANRGAFTRTAA